jgi:hypothetical protein
MPKSKDRDFFVNARRVVELAIGEQMDGKPLPDPNAGKNPASVAAGKIAGKKGGKARAQVLTAEQRRRIAVKAARARWKSQVDD